jgi:hypothetical protein
MNRFVGELKELSKMLTGFARSLKTEYSTPRLQDQAVLESP